jgi:hypothetical protein
MIRSTTLADKALFIFLIVISVSGLFFVQELFPSGSRVKIILDGKTAYSFSLDEDRSVKVRGPLGDSFIEVKDGKVRMKDSPCPRKLCVNQGWIDRGAIACLPNKVIISVDGHEELSEQGEIDAVTR